MNQAALSTITDPKILELIKMVEKFDFKFFGLSENKEPLMMAPNGQVVPLQVAYNFVKTKLIDPAQSSGSPESMPSMPVVPEVVSEQVDVNIEKEPEIEKQAEKAPEVAPNNPQSDLQVKAVAPKQAVLEPKIDLPFGDGYYPKDFDPTSVQKAQAFIAANSGKSPGSSEKWLSILWDKFIKELSEE